MIAQTACSITFETQWTHVFAARQELHPKHHQLLQADVCPAFEEGRAECHEPNSHAKSSRNLQKKRNPEKSVFKGKSREYFCNRGRMTYFLSDLYAVANKADNAGPEALDIICTMSSIKALHMTLQRAI